jgi:hypothetical protein
VKRSQYPDSWYDLQMAKKAKPTPKLNAESHKRFVKMAREVVSSDDPKVLEKALAKIVLARRLKPGRWLKTNIKIGPERPVGRKKRPA